jgi:hypothetical protein
LGIGVQVRNAEKKNMLLNDWSIKIELNSVDILIVYIRHKRSNILPFYRHYHHTITAITTISQMLNFGSKYIYFGEEEYEVVPGFSLVLIVE